MSEGKERFVIRYSAGPGEVYAEGCFDSQIGQPMPVTRSDKTVEGVLVAADVAPDGSGIVMTIEVPAGFLPPAQVNRFSNGTAP